MPNTFFLIFNHELTPAQRADATISLGVTQVAELPAALKRLWEQIPPDLDALGAYLEPIRRWLADQAQKGDYVLIQGDFGATYILVNAAFEMGLIPVYSTTERLATEIRNDDGSMETIHRIKHVSFRKYEVL